MRWDYMVPFAVAVLLAMLTWSTSVSANQPGDTDGVQTVRIAYPGSVDSFVERRRDLRDRQREHYLDWRTGRRWYSPPWINAQRDWTNAREDAMRERFRQRRDARDHWHDNVNRWHNPWSQWVEDRNDAWRDANELDRLAREEYFDRLRYRGPWGYPF